MSSAHREQQSLQGQWVVADARPVKAEPGEPVGRRELGGVLAVGPVSYDGVTIKTALHRRRVAYNLLVGRMKHAAREDIRIDDDEIPGSGGVWKVRVLPIRSPITHVLVGVMACYIRSRADWADYPTPVVGPWEWLITPAGSGHENVMGWSDALFELYGLTSPDERKAATVNSYERLRYPHGRWFDGWAFVTNRVLEPWRPAVQNVRDRMLAQPGDLHLCSFKTFHNRSGSTLALRFAARGDPDEPYWFRGVTMPDTSAVTPADDRPPGARGVLTLSKDPLLVVDTWLEEIEAISKAFEALRLSVGADGHIRRCVHIRSQEALIELLRRAAAEPGHEVGPERISWATLDGEQWRDFDVVAAGERVPNDSHSQARYVVVRLDPVTA